MYMYIVHVHVVAHDENTCTMTTTTSYIQKHPLAPPPPPEINPVHVYIDGTNIIRRLRVILHGTGKHSEHCS